MISGQLAFRKSSTSPCRIQICLLNSQYLSSILLSMLTKSDLSQIRKVIREEVENEVRTTRTELQADITMARMRLQSEIQELKDRIKNLEIRITKMHRELKEEIKIVSHVLDKENLRTIKKVEKIEEHLGLSSTQ